MQNETHSGHRRRIHSARDLSAPQGVRGRNADMTLAGKIIGNEQKVSLEEGLERTYRWIEMKCKEDKQTMAYEEQLSAKHESQIAEGALQTRISSQI